MDPAPPHRFPRTINLTFRKKTFLFCLSFVVFAGLVVYFLILPKAIEHQKRHFEDLLRQLVRPLSVVYKQDESLAMTMKDPILMSYKEDGSIKNFEVLSLVLDDTSAQDRFGLTTKEKEQLTQGTPVYKWKDLSPMMLYPIDRSNSKGVLFLLAVYGDDQVVSDAVSKLKTQAYTLFALFGGAFLISGFLFALWVSRPIQRLVEASKEVADSESTVTLMPDLDGEAGQIALNLNRMISRFNHTHQELESYTKNLERIIELRTERLNNALRDIQQQKDLVEDIISSVGALIVMLDKEGRVILFNRTAEETLGYKEEEVLGRVIWEVLIPEDSLQLAIDGFQRALNSLRDSLEISLLTRQGSRRLILWQITVVKEEDEIKYILATGMDITEKRRLERYITDAQRFQSLATMLSGLSHNFNNLLVGIMGYAGLARIRLSALNNDGLAEELNRYLDIIENSSQRAADLIRHIRGFTKRIEYEKVSYNINESVEHIIALLSAVMPSSIRIEKELSEDLRIVHADRHTIQQALMNICINAKEAMPEGGTLRITTKNVDLKAGEVNMLPEGKYVQISISDTGVGILEDNLSKIFEPFFTTKSVIDHMGLGLTQTYSVITDHKGDILVKSTHTAGSTFHIYLPAK